MHDIILNNKPKYKFVIENFEGPLDLLLYLISKNKMNIFDISLSKLTDEYISYLNEMTEQNIEVASEFIVMASTLLDIKARKLLPELKHHKLDNLIDYFNLTKRNEHRALNDCVLTNQVYINLVNFLK